MSPDLDVIVLGEALIDIVTTSAGAAERPGGSPAAAPITVGREGMDSPTREDLQLFAAPRESV